MTVSLSLTEVITLIWEVPALPAPLSRLQTFSVAKAMWEEVSYDNSHTTEFTLEKAIEFILWIQLGHTC